MFNNVVRAGSTALCC